MKSMKLQKLLQILQLGTLKYDVLSEMKNRISDNKFGTSIDKCALVELAMLSLEFMLFTVDQKILKSKQSFIHRHTNFSMFHRNLY